MVLKSSRLRLALGALLLTTASAAADCPAGLVAAFDRATASKNIDAAQSAMLAIQEDIACSDIDDFRRKLIDFEIDLAANPSTPAADRKKALEGAKLYIAIGGTWREAEQIGDYYESVKDDIHAFEWYEKSISFLAARPSAAANEKDRYELRQRVVAAEILANSDAGGKREGNFDRCLCDERLEGIYSPLLLPDVVEQFPLPISFYPGETRFTEVGEAAAAEFAKALVEQDVRALGLVGHTDSGGDPQLNVNLSLRRAETVRDALLKRGVKARITVDGKGDAEPFDDSALVRPLSQDEAWRLDRRVEWIRSGETR